MTICQLLRVAPRLRYSGPSVCALLLRLEPALLPRVRRELMELGLIAFQRPLYQVLALSDTAPQRPRPQAPPPPSAPNYRSLWNGKSGVSRSWSSDLLKSIHLLPESDQALWIGWVASHDEDTPAASRNFP